jgi:hypothetical protein
MKLGLTVLDPSGNVVGQGKGQADVHEVTWIPGVTGRYTIRVESKGPLRKGREFWSQYVLTTD